MMSKISLVLCICIFSFFFFYLLPKTQCYVSILQSLVISFSFPPSELVYSGIPCSGSNIEIAVKWGTVPLFIHSCYPSGIIIVLSVNKLGFSLLHCSSKCFELQCQNHYLWLFYLLKLEQQSCHQSLRRRNTIKENFKTHTPARIRNKKQQD